HEEKAGEHGETTAASDGKRHARALPRALAMLPVADQKERRKTRELPEDREKQEVVREHDAEHRPHEQREPRVELAGWVSRFEVVACIENDEQSDAEDQQHEEQGEAVEPQADVEVDAGDPR